MEPTETQKLLDRKEELEAEIAMFDMLEAQSGIDYSDDEQAAQIELDSINAILDDIIEQLR